MDQQTADTPTLPLHRRFLAGLRSWAFTLVLAALIVMAVGSLRGGLPLHGPAPALRAVDLHGKPVDLADHRGHPVVLYFWASWCSACKLTSPTVEQFARSHPEVPVLGVAMEEAEDVKAYLQGEERAMRVLPATEAIQRAWGVRALPTTAIVGPDGAILWSRQGVLVPGELNWRVP